MILPLFSLGMAGIWYAAFLPGLLLPIFALLFIPSMLTPGARPAGIAKAIYCYVLLTFGIVLMTVSGLPAMYAVLEKLLFAQDRFTTEIYVALLLIFAAGGLTFLWHETIAATVDEPSRRVCAALFWFLFKMLGYLLMVIAGLSFFLTMLLVREPFTGAWWIMPLLLFLYGLLLSWVTRAPAMSPGQFRSTPMTSPKMPTPKKMAGKKGKKKASA
jgi:hypothetical protein